MTVETGEEHAIMDGEPGTGANPGAGATPATPPPPADPPKPPATGDDLGDGGKRALEAERTARGDAEKRAKAAEDELARVREATSSEGEKAIAAAKREASAEERAKWQERFRSAEVRGALRGAGIINDRMLALAVAAPEFASLTVSDDGNVQGVSEAVEAFKTAMPEAFAPKADDNKPPAGAPRSGVQQPPAPEVKPGYERMSAAYAANAASKNKT